MTTAVCDGCYQKLCAAKGMNELEVYSMRPLTNQCDLCGAIMPRWLMGDWVRAAHSKLNNGEPDAPPIAGTL